LWLSIDAKHKPLSGLKVRQWAAQLLSRSILLGSSTDGVAMHDIVRDFTLAAHTTTALQQRQRQFSQALIDHCTTNDDKSTTVARRYMRRFLNVHVRDGVSAPLSKDTAAQGWLLHTDSDVVDQCFVAINLTDIEELAEWLTKDKEDFFAASRLWLALAKKGSGLTVAKRAQYYRHCVKAVDQTNPAIPGASDFEVQVRHNLITFTDQQHESDTSVLKIKALVDDDTRFQQLSAGSRVYAQATIGLAFFGFCNSTFCVCPSFDQLQAGSKSYIQLTFGVRANLTKQGFAGWYARMTSVNVYGNFSMTHITPEVLNDPITVQTCLGESGEEIVKWVDAYKFEEFHSIAQARFEDHVSALFTPLIMLDRFADVPNTLRFIDIWLAADAQAKAAGLQNFEPPSTSAWPRLPAAVLQTSMAMWQVSWLNAAEEFSKLPPDKFAWTREVEGGRNVFCLARAASLMHAKLTILAKLPHTVQQSEATDFLPSPDEPLFADRLYETCRFRCPSLLAAHTAQNVTGDRRLVKQYARATLQIHMNPILQHYAYTTIGAATLVENTDTDEE